MGSMLASVVDFVVGVDTHRDTHTAAFVDARTGGVIDQITVPTDAFGYRRLRSFADQPAKPSAGNTWPHRGPAVTARPCGY